jgi:Cdc6-like AAA superfamily ATPase
MIFARVLYKKLVEKVVGDDDNSTAETFRSSLKRVDSWDDEQISDRLAKVLSYEQEDNHKILVIDEIDHFQRQEKSFMTIMKRVLTTDHNTTIVGIANSVDLPFRKTANALSLRDKQVLFKPYSTEELVEILEMKMFNMYKEIEDKELRMFLRSAML